MKINILLLLFFGILSLSAKAQSHTQTVRGRVIDKQIETPLLGVNVVVLQDEKTYGGVTDGNGYFQINNVPTGRINLAFSFIGYKPVTMQNIELLSSKELILNVAMLESTEELDEVVVQGRQEKSRVQNERVNVSARTFSIEETQRFAGSVQDVSRMASNFAGVQRANDAQNDIVIRGNSPIGLIWRLEGVDIPNPNHFGGLGATGGPVSMLNNNVLANSDFLTSAFPSEYGDGISGVFDLQMRNGNYENHEFLGQIGFNGFELGAEGPINREKRSSYLINYRYSTLGVFSALGIDFGTGTAIPYYQDLNLKVHLPLGEKTIVEVFGLGGISNIDFLDSKSEEEEDGGFYSDDEDLRFQARTGVIGASHQYFFDKSLYSKITFSANTIANFTKSDSLNDERVPGPQYRQEFIQNNIQFSGFLNKKFNAKNVIRFGTYITMKNYDLMDSAFAGESIGFRTLRDQQSTDWLYQPYVNWQLRPSDKWELNLGLHSMYLQSNQNFSLEPRFGASYSSRENQSLNFGYGLHSQIPNPSILYDQIRLDNGTYILPNEDLDFVRSHHLVLGYDLFFGSGYHFKSEAYFQYIFDAIVQQKPSAYSNLNAGGFETGAPDSITNGGEGRNFGLDLTFEKYMEKGFYLLSTLSLYQSEYQGSDGVWRNTAFNGNYVFNLLGGKEFVLSEGNLDGKKRNTITVDLKTTLAGGQRYTPLDLPESIAEGEAVYDNSQPYSEQFKPYFRPDIRIGYKQSGKRVTQEFAIDIQNVINRDNPFGIEYDAENQEEIITNQLGLFPMFLYRITF